MSTAALTLPSEQVVWRPKVNPWAIAATVSMAAFIEVLDTSVANVALPYIAGGLGASYDDSTWVLTSYLAANAIVLPISGWLAEMIGRKRYFMMSLSIFTVSSLLCGLAPSLPVLLFFRALQGIGGGGLQPMAQAILNDTFPPEQRGQAFAVYGVTAVLAPTVGPMLGGWITDSYSWRWIFFITLPAVALALYLTHILVEDPPFLRRIEARGHPGGLHWNLHVSAGSGFAADTSGQGAGRRLVWVAFHHDPGRSPQRFALSRWSSGNGFAKTRSSMSACSRASTLRQRT